MLVKTIHILALMIMVFFSRCDTVTPPTAKLDIQADMILFIDRNDFDTLRKEILDVIPSYLEMAEDKVRIVAWCVADSYQLTRIVDWTGNKMHFTKALQDFKPADRRAEYTIYQFPDQLMILKASQRSGIPKFMHIVSVRVSNAGWDNIQGEKAEAPGDYCHRSYTLSGRQSVKGCNQFGEALMKLLCGQEKEACTFNKTGACISYGGSLIQIDPLECSKFPDLKPKPCNRTTCESFCATVQWTIVKQACSGKCGKIQFNLTSSNIPEAQKKMLSRCPAHFKEIQCPCMGRPLPETSTTDSPKTVLKISVSPRTVPNSSRPTADLKSFTGVWQKHGPKTEASAQDEANAENTHPPEGSSVAFPWWAIIVIVAGGSMAILGIALAVLIYRINKKPAPYTIATYPPITSPKVAVVVKGVDAAVGGESGAAGSDESVGVSLKEDLTAQSQKTKGSSVNSSIKGEGQLSEKSGGKSGRAVF